MRLIAKEAELAEKLAEPDSDEEFRVSGPVEDARAEAAFLEEEAEELSDHGASEGWEEGAEEEWEEELAAQLEK